MTLKSKVYYAGIEKNWEFFRSSYDRLDIEDLIWINTKWDSVLPYQSSHSIENIKKMFLNINKSEVKVVELGSYRGLLGDLILKEFSKVVEWHGYDINHSAIEDGIKNDRLFHHKLEEWFWEIDVSGFDVFVSTHTLEHFSFSQFKKVIHAVSVCEYLVLEIPIANDWSNCYGSHVLLTTFEQVESILNLTHNKIIDCSDNRKLIISLWKKKEE